MTFAPYLSVSNCAVPIAWSLQRYQEARCLHFITFSCQHRDPLLGTPRSRDRFLQTLEKVRLWYGFFVSGFVVMPEHVHLLISEPERSKLSVALQMLKQNAARELRPIEGFPSGASLLRLQRMEQSQADREAAVHPPQSGSPRTL
jgi:REP element-mobilizing transposase RayT